MHIVNVTDGFIFLSYLSIYIASTFSCGNVQSPLNNISNTLSLFTKKQHSKCLRGGLPLLNTCQISQNKYCSGVKVALIQYIFSTVSDLKLRECQIQCFICEPCHFSNKSNSGFLFLFFEHRLALCITASAG